MDASKKDFVDSCVKCERIYNILATLTLRDINETTNNLRLALKNLKEEGVGIDYIKDRWPYWAILLDNKIN